MTKAYLAITPEFAIHLIKRSIKGFILGMGFFLSFKLSACKSAVHRNVGII